MKSVNLFNFLKQNIGTVYILLDFVVFEILFILKKKLYRPS